MSFASTMWTECKSRRQSEWEVIVSRSQAHQSQDIGDDLRRLSGVPWEERVCAFLSDSIDHGASSVVDLLTTVSKSCLFNDAEVGELHHCVDELLLVSNAGKTKELGEGEYGASHVHCHVIPRPVHQKGEDSDKDWLDEGKTLIGDHIDESIGTWSSKEVLKSVDVSWGASSSGHHCEAQQYQQRFVCHSLLIDLIIIVPASFSHQFNSLLGFWGFGFLGFLDLVWP